MRCAFLNEENNIVENVIVADASVDPAPNGFYLINLPEDSLVTFGWKYNKSTGEFTPPSEQ